MRTRLLGTLAVFVIGAIIAFPDDAQACYWCVSEWPNDRQQCAQGNAWWTCTQTCTSTGCTCSGTSCQVATLPAHLRPDGTVESSGAEISGERSSSDSADERLVVRSCESAILVRVYPGQEQTELSRSVSAIVF